MIVLIRMNNAKLETDELFTSVNCYFYLMFCLVVITYLHKY